MTLYKNSIPAFWNFFTYIWALGILFMIWLMYFFMVRASDANKFIIPPFILCSFLSLSAFVPFFFLYAAKNTSYEINPEGVVIVNSSGKRGLWPYNCIITSRKITMSQLSAESLTMVLKKQYIGTAMLPVTLLPAWLSPEPRIVIDTSVSAVMGLKFSLILNPEDMDQFLAELTARLALNNSERARSN